MFMKDLIVYYLKCWSIIMEKMNIKTLLVNYFVKKIMEQISFCLFLTV